MAGKVGNDYKSSLTLNASPVFLTRVLMCLLRTFSSIEEVVGTEAGAEDDLEGSVDAVASLVFFLVFLRPPRPSPFAFPFPNLPVKKTAMSEANRKRG